MTIEHWAKVYLASDTRIADEQREAVPEKWQASVRSVEAFFSRLPLQRAVEALEACQGNVTEAVRYLKQKARAQGLALIDLRVTHELTKIEPGSLGMKQERTDEDVKKEGCVDESIPRPPKRLRGESNIKAEKSDEDGNDNGTKHYPVSDVYTLQSDVEIEDASEEKLSEMLKAALAHVDRIEKALGKVPQQPPDSSSP